MRRLLITLALAGCSSPAPLELCGQVPEGGCPIGRGGTCDDFVCTALYDCVDGDWTQVEACPGGASASTTTSTTSTGACGEPTGAGGGSSTGACPTLQLPDCPASFATGCDACSLGCEDFFECRDGGWEPVAYCDEGGDVIGAE